MSHPSLILFSSLCIINFKQIPQMKVMLIGFLIDMRSKFPHGYLSFILQLQLSMPSDHSGIHGMQQEQLRCTPIWHGEAPCCDCAYVVDDNEDGFCGMSIV
jgi:hypothetical protein